MSKLISLSFNYFTKTNPLIRFTDNIDKVIPKIVQPKVRIVDGKVVVDKSSLLQQMEEQTTEISEEVVEDFEDMPEEINSLSFRTRKHGKRSKNWSDEETDRFYEAITIVGTNFVYLINQFSSQLYTLSEWSRDFKRLYRCNRFCEKPFLWIRKFSILCLNLFLHQFLGNSIFRNYIFLSRRKQKTLNKTHQSFPTA